MKVMSIFGTRPEMIKMWGTLKKLDELNFEHVMVHTGQNFTPELKDFFFRDLQLRKPDYELGIDTSSYGKEVSDVVRKSDELMEKINQDMQSIGKVELQPKFDGKQMIMVIQPL